MLSLSAKLQVLLRRLTSHSLVFRPHQLLQNGCSLLWQRVCCLNHVEEAAAFCDNQILGRYWCRHCHNDAEDTVAALRCVPPTSHTLDRYAVKEASAADLALISADDTTCRLFALNATRASPSPTLARPVAYNSVRTLRRVCSFHSVLFKARQANIFAPSATFGIIVPKKRSTTTATDVACVASAAETGAHNAITPYVSCFCLAKLTCAP